VFKLLAQSPVQTDATAASDGPSPDDGNRAARDQQEKTPVDRRIQPKGDRLGGAGNQAVAAIDDPARDRPIKVPRGVGDQAADAGDRERGFQRTKWIAAFHTAQLRTTAWLRKGWTRGLARGLSQS
jgi:hypothetical protein